MISKPSSKIVWRKLWITFNICWHLGLRGKISMIQTHFWPKCPLFLNFVHLRAASWWLLTNHSFGSCHISKWTAPRMRIPITRVQQIRNFCDEMKASSKSTTLWRPCLLFRCIPNRGLFSPLFYINRSIRASRDGVALENRRTLKTDRKASRTPRLSDGGWLGRIPAWMLNVKDLTTSLWPTHSQQSTSKENKMRSVHLWKN